SLGMVRVTFLRLCSRAPRIVISSVGIRTFGYSFSRAVANVALAVATRRPPGPSTLHSVTAVRRPAGTTRPAACSFSPTLAAEMKLSFRSKLIARATPGLRVPRLRPMAESARVLMMPPWTNPAWLAMSSKGVISTVALSSPSSTWLIPSHRHAGEGSDPTSRPFGPPSPASREGLLTALALRHRHAGGRSARYEPPLLVHHVRLAEEQALAHLDHPAGRPEAALDRRPQEVDLQLDGGVPHAVFLQRGQGHAHRGVCDLRDHASLDDPTPVPVLRARDQLQHDPSRLRLDNPGSKGLH